MKIKCYMGEYNVNYEDSFDFLKQYGGTGTLMVIDKKVYGLYKDKIGGCLDNIVLIEADEHTKVLETAAGICERATFLDAKRNLIIAAIGGGIIQDIAGIAANMLYRGVKLVLVPTTLLAQGDSCIGSKNSINFGAFKNLLGTIYPPHAVHVCRGFLPTLTHGDFNSGLGEITRFIIMSGDIEYVESKLDELMSRNDDALSEAIKMAHEYKKKMVEIDEFDLKERRIFNYGHTFGHALESVSDYRISHGLAVAVGMIMANNISANRGILREETATRIERIAKRLVGDTEIFISDAKLFIDTLRKDKKRRGSGIAAVLASDGWRFAVVQDVALEEVEKAVDYINGLWL